MAVPLFDSGRQLLAHELAHTVQQRRATDAFPSPDSTGIFEASATAAARDVTAGRAVSHDLPAGRLGISRQPVAEEDRPKPVPGLPATLSLVHPDPRQLTDEELFGEIESRKRDEEKATKERKERELKESHDRLLILRGKLDRSGYMYSKNQVLAMITKDSLLDLQLLTRHGLDLPGFFTKRKTFYHNVIAAIDKFEYEWRKTRGTAGPVANPTDVEALEAMQRQQEAEAARWEGLEHVEGSLAGAVGAEATSWFTSDPKKITAGAKMGTGVSGVVGSAATAKAVQIEQRAIRESSKTSPVPAAAVGTTPAASLAGHRPRPGQ